MYMNKSILFVLALFSYLTAFPQNDSILFAGEPHFKNVIQLDSLDLPVGFTKWINAND